MPIRLTVLIIEDEVVIRELLYEILDEILHTYGYSIMTAATVQEAEEIRQRLAPEGIGLVLTDINLSHTSHGQEGYDLFQRWTEAHPTLPFVLMSAAASSLALPAMCTRSVRVVSKPFDLDALLDVVQSLLAKQ